LQVRSEGSNDDAGGAGLLALDRSHGLVVLRLTGHRVPWLLAQLAALDFPALAGAAAPRCDQTRLAQIRVVVLTRPTPEAGVASFDLLVERSLARYLWERLADAAHHVETLVPQGM